MFIKTFIYINSMKKDIIIQDTKKHILRDIQDNNTESHDDVFAIEDNQLVHKYVDSSLDVNHAAVLGVTGIILGFIIGAIASEIYEADYLFVITFSIVLICWLFGLFYNKLSPNKTNYLDLHFSESNGKTLVKADYNGYDSMEVRVMDYLILNYDR